MGSRSFTPGQEPRLDSPTATLRCRGTVRIGCLSSQSMRPTRIPPEVQQALSGA